MFVQLVCLRVYCPKLMRISNFAGYFDGVISGTWGVYRPGNVGTNLGMPEEKRSKQAVRAMGVHTVQKPSQRGNANLEEAAEETPVFDAIPQRKSPPTGIFIPMGLNPAGSQQETARTDPNNSGFPMTMNSWFPSARFRPKDSP